MEVADILFNLETETPSKVSNFGYCITTHAVHPFSIVFVGRNRLRLNRR